MADNANSTPTTHHHHHHHQHEPHHNLHHHSNKHTAKPQPIHPHESNGITTTASNNGIPNATASPPRHKECASSSTTGSSSKIAVMQLFHEMKQTFATVPDYLVGQYVADNAHDRAALRAQLSAEAARAGAGTVQAYPQALRQQSQHSSAAVAAAAAAASVPSVAAAAADNDHRTTPTTTPTTNEISPSTAHDITTKPKPASRNNNNNNPTDASTNANPTTPNHSVNQHHHHHHHQHHHHSFNQQRSTLNPPFNIGQQQPQTQSQQHSAASHRPHRLPPSPPRRLLTATTTMKDQHHPLSDGELQPPPSVPLRKKHELCGRRRSRSNSRSHNTASNADDGNENSSSSSNSVADTSKPALDLRTNNPSDTSSPLHAPLPHHPKPKVPERPRTLTLHPQRAPPAFNAPILQPPSPSPPRGQPTRPAPRPPVEHQPPINVSVNVTVSQTNDCAPSASASPPSSSSATSSPLSSLSATSPQPQSPAHLHRRTIRHTTELSVQPERWPLASSSAAADTDTDAAFALSPRAAAKPSTFNVADAGAGHGAGGTPMRSFTSVQFKLRPPATTTTTSTPETSDTAETSFSHMRSTAASPIDISAGPSLLTYSSASYDARKGLHSNFQITVDGGGNGTISAMRTRPNYAANGHRPSPTQQQQQQLTTQLTTTTAGTTASTTTTTQVMVASSLGMTASSTTTTTTTSATKQQHALVQQHQPHQTVALARNLSGGVGGNYPSWEADIVHRQLLCKQRLCVELENDRLRLTRMQHEIQTLRSPIPVGGADRLEDEILRLQSSCKRMVQQVEEAGPYVLGETNEAFYHQIMSTQTFDRPASLSSQPRLLGSPSGHANASFSTSPQRHYSHPHHKQQQQQQQQYQQQNYHNDSLSPCSASSPSTPSVAAATSIENDCGRSPASTAAAAVAPQLPWACNMCTFQNHPLLNKCEQCEMPLLTTSGTVPTQTLPCVSFATLLSSASAVATPDNHHNRQANNNSAMLLVGNDAAASGFSGPIAR